MMKEKRIEPSDQPGEAEEEETSATPTDFYPQTRQGQPRGAVFFLFAAHSAVLGAKPAAPRNAAKANS